MMRDDRYSDELKKLIEQAKRQGHVAIENALYTLLLKRTAPRQKGQDGGQDVHRTSVNHEKL